MHSAARALRDLFGIFVALALLGCVLTLPTAAGAARDPEPAVATAEDAELLRLAEQAKGAFRRRMEPPQIQITVVNIFTRDSTAIVRDYARESYEAAVDALLAEARTPERASAIKAALRQLVNTGDADLAEVIFKEMLERKAAEGDDAKRDAAAAARHSVALVELPAALASRIKPPGEALPFPPLGRKAAPIYVRAAELDPDDPWNWIVLALLADTPEALDHAIQNAKEAAQNAGDRRAMIAALYVLGLVHGHAQAEQAYNGALAVAREWANDVPTSVAAQRYLALSLNRRGDALREQRRYDEAAAAYQEALAVRHRLAEAEPDNSQRQIDLIAAHMNLAVLATGDQDKAEFNKQWNEASRIHNALLARDPFDPGFLPLESGGVAILLMFAGVLTLVIGLIALTRYRRVIARWMKVAAEAGASSGSVTTISRARLAEGQSEIPLLSVEATKRCERASPFRSAAIAGAVRASRRAAWVYTVAGIAFASVSAVLELHLSSFEITWPRMILAGLPWAWPVVFTLALLWGPDRRRLGLLIISYFGILLAFCTRTAFSEAPPLDVWGMTLSPFVQPLVVFALDAYPTLFLLVFLNRHVRAIGPVLLVLMIIVGIGGVAAWIGASTYAGLTVVTPLMTLLNLSPQMVDMVVLAIGMLLFLPLGWLGSTWLRRQYNAKRFSEQALVFDSIWLFQTLILCRRTVNAAGPTGWLALSAFAIYKLITWIGLRPVATAAAGRLPARLLLLRTFGFRKRSERFFDLLGARWRYAGPIQLIAAPDLAARSIDPNEFLAFLSGRLRHRFISEPGDLERRFAEVDNRPDPDGRYRVNQFFCGNDGWRAAVTRLMAESDLVAMDLRGFSAGNQGCLFELQSLIDTVPVACIVLLTDKSTDAPFLRRTLAECWQGMDATSPNRQAIGALTLLETSRRDSAAVAALMAIADSVLVPAQTPLVPAVAVTSAAAQ
jgi:tetratricopeptide (TPR) repeat protein